MAKKSASSEKMSLDDYDFGSEFDFDEFSMEPKPIKNARDAIERLGGGALEGAVDTFKSPSFFRELIKKALPRGYGDMLDLADQSASTLRGLYNEGAKELKPALKEVARVTEKLMPTDSKYVPKSAQALVKKFIEANKGSTQIGVGAQTANEMAVAAMMQDTFAYGAKEDARREAKADVKDGMQETLAKTRHADSVGQLDGIRRSVVSMAAYQKRIEFNYQKKSLELQARQYFVSVDLLNETKRHNVRSQEFLNGILHNTALPDLVKMKTSERFKDMMRTKMMGSLSDGIFGQRNNFMQNIGKAFRDQALGHVRGFASGLSDGVQGLETVSDTADTMNDMGMDRTRMAGSLVGGQVAGWGAKAAASKYGKKFLGTDNRVANGVRKIGNKAQFVAANASQLASDWSNSSVDGETYVERMLSGRLGNKLSDNAKRNIGGVGGAILNPIIDVLRGTVRQANTTDNRIKTNGINEMHHPAAFSNQAHRSLVEVIPGYLARILQEARIARTGDTSIDLPQYDYAKGKFSKTKDVRKAVFSKLVDKQGMDGVQNEQKRMLEMIDPRGQLNAKQRKELSKLLMSDNLRGRAGYETGKISNYTHSSSFAGSKHSEKYAGLFKDLHAKNQASQGVTANEFAERFSSLGRSVSERRADIQQLLEVYPREMLEDLRILKPGTDEIDMQQLQRYFSGETYSAQAAMAGGGVRALPSPAGAPPQNRLRQRRTLGSEPQRQPSPPQVGSTDLSRLLELIEQQNTRPLISDIKDILLEMQQHRQADAEPSGPGFMDRTMDMANRAGQAGMTTARRAKRLAQVTAGRLRQQHQGSIDTLQQRAQELLQSGNQQATRIKRMAQVKAGRLRQQHQGSVDEIGGRLNDMWNDRPSLEELRDRLNERLQQASNFAGQQAQNAQAGAQGFGNRMKQGMSGLFNRQPQMEPTANKTLVEIKDVLLAIQARLDDGIITMAMPEDPSRLQRLRSGVRGMGGAVKRGASRLNMRLTDVAGGLFKLGAGVAGLGGKLVNNTVGAGIRGAWGLGKGVAGIAGDATVGIVGSQYRRTRGFIDIYVGAERRPRLYGRILQEGNVYFDQATNKPIRRLKDITGTVIRRTAAGDEVVLEAEEIAAAWQRVGPVKKTLKALGVVVKGGFDLTKGALGMVTSAIPPILKAAWWGVKKVWGLTDMAQDIYVKDKLDDPALTARIMRAGGYMSAVSGKIISKPSQVDGPVMSGDEVVLTHDDIRKGLVDKNNKPIRSGLSKMLRLTFGGVGVAARLGVKAGRLANKAVRGLVTGGAMLGGAALKAGGAVGGGAFDLARGRNPFRQMGDGDREQMQMVVTNQSNGYLKEIRDLLKSRLVAPKKHTAEDKNDDGIRDGSYEDQMRQKATDKARTEAGRPGAGPAAPGVKGAAGGSLLGGLWNKLRGKKNADGDDDGSGDTTILGGIGGSANRGPRPPGAKWGDAQGFKGKAKFLGGKAWGLTKGIGKVGAGLLGLEGLGIGGALLGAGSAVASGVAAAAGAIGAGLGAAAGAVGAVLSAPVLLGAAAVAGLAVGGYMAYKYLSKKKLGLLSRIRYAQYGFYPTDNDHVNAVFGLEDKLRPAVVFGKEGPKLDSKNVKAEDLASDFDVDMKNERELNNFLQWFGNRFKPVFLTHVAALKANAPDKWLSDVDGLEPAVALKYMNASRFPEGPYGESTSPFKDIKSLKAGKGDVNMLISLAETELTKKAKDKPASGIAGVAAVGAAVAVKAATVPATPGSGVSQKVLAAAAAGGSVAALKGGQVAVGANVVLTGLGSNSVDGLDVVRMKTYGLVKMESDKVKALMALEREVGKDVTFDKNTAKWNGSLEKILANQGAAFGVDITNTDLAANWLNWFNQRFLPAYLNYISVVKVFTGKDNTEEGKGLLKASQAVEVATSVFTSNGKSGSVWNVSVSPWLDYKLNADVRSTDGNIQAMKDLVKASVLAEPGGKAGNQPTANKSAANTSTVPKSGGIVGGVMAAASSAWGGIKSLFTGPSPTPTSPSGSTAMGGGRDIEQPGKGTAGDINNIPQAKGKGWANVKDTIMAAAKMVGVDAKLLAAMAKIESGFNPDIKAPGPNASATGLFQFIRSTWDWMLGKFGKKYGIAPGTPPTDARANALMGAEYMKMSIAGLDGKIGRSVTDTDVYMSHFLGPGGARKFLNLDPSAIAATVMPKEAAANRGVFYDRQSNPLTVAQIYQNMGQKVKNGTNGLSFDGGEALVDSPKTAPPPATAPSVPAATPPTKSAFAVGTDTSGKAPPAPVAATPSAPPVAPTATPLPSSSMGALAGGFMPPRSAQDQMAATRQQNDTRTLNMTDTNKILSDTLQVQRDSLDVLKDIAKRIQPAASAPVAPASQDARYTPRKPTDMPKPPISVARPPAPV